MSFYPNRADTIDLLPKEEVRADSENSREIPQKINDDPGVVFQNSDRRPSTEKYSLRLRAMIWVASGVFPWIILHMVFWMLL
ncbi:hypothetical protein [Azospirillum canadense]|uniref:hypothetical protein n=1 Tax=Azospirillum canadense TaxID=403962 RepID=UPI0022275CB0|nr:hypothetical protein [Azospirillum canadense]MCW2240886.1 hypothetical protein [Azospirillum canadense]